ncbi:hypothetical protein ABEG10_38395 (plasmid) [Burkholderia cenocepacia]|uniref:hypothetical protein n=1 Tax=Burkholderia cenocepacia TaxID=95486 RepID=UPI00209CB50A|nr:hypothetical protein [Burkholderia cenocepacia]MCO8402839.1 hypothetical protein [Burkholderia cenocepacia]MCO8415078.1 hypothetical protein [Burkholderia cenocepacia]MCO8423123.1 hypothetical protein [Burkholderia cenocepacia]MCO8474825.1 hypothetical protein [Burkholderia cenocepacia]MCO8481995.1 hypothetical protein [Burkholderia cenocepacia]
MDTRHPFKVVDGDRDSRAEAELLDHPFDPKRLFAVLRSLRPAANANLHLVQPNEELTLPSGLPGDALPDQPQRSDD